MKRNTNKKKENNVQIAMNNIYEYCNQLGRELIDRASSVPSIKCNNPSKIIVFDVETTGFDPECDEILQISIIDGDGNTLLNEYVKPYWNMEWEAAYKIHGISSADVENAPRPHELIPKVKGIFESAELLIGYNMEFDLSMLEQWNIEPTENQNKFDVMHAFSKIYGEWNECFGNYRWQKLSTAAAYYDYKFDAHDSLEDVKATLYVYKKIKERESIHEKQPNSMQDYYLIELQKKEIKTIKERKITVKLSDEDCYRLARKCGEHGLTVGELIENFIGDLVGGTYSNGSDERDYAERWFERCWFGMFPKPTLLNHLLCWGYEPEDYLDLLDNIKTAQEDKKYFDEHPEEADEEVQYIDDDIVDWEEKLKEMRADWKSEKEMNTEEEIALIKKWVKEREDFINE